MKIGTRSLLFGVHCFLIHPFFVGYSWYRLFGFPRDPRLWMAFFLHDIGYWGKPDMDGPNGERHPELGATLMGALFGRQWHDFTLLHSRSYARLLGREPSRLCAADKLVVYFMPCWLYLPLAWLTGELRGYMERSALERAALGTVDGRCSAREWFASLQIELKSWADAYLQQNSVRPVYESSDQTVWTVS